MHTAYHSYFDILMTSRELRGRIDRTRDPAILSALVDTLAEMLDLARSRLDYLRRQEQADGHLESLRELSDRELQEMEAGHAAA